MLSIREVAIQRLREDDVIAHNTVIDAATLQEATWHLDCAITWTAALVVGMLVVGAIAPYILESVVVAIMVVALLVSLVFVAREVLINRAAARILRGEEKLHG